MPFLHPFYAYPVPQRSPGHFREATPNLMEVGGKVGQVDSLLPKSRGKSRGKTLPFPLPTSRAKSERGTASLNFDRVLPLPKSGGKSRGKSRGQSRGKTRYKSKQREGRGKSRGETRNHSKRLHRTSTDFSPYRKVGGKPGIKKNKPR